MTNRSSLIQMSQDQADYANK